jgi:hypothetical protein
MTDLDALAALAEKATNEEAREAAYLRRYPTSLWTVMTNRMAFREAADPTAVKSLIAEVLVLREDCDRIIARLRAAEAVCEAAQTYRDQHIPDPDDPCGMGYDANIPGGYGTIDPACRICGTPDEYAVPWPCPTHSYWSDALDAWEATR